MDRSYFGILDSIDPLFHSFVLTRIDEINSQEQRNDITIDHFNETDQLDILRRYCMTVYSEYSALRSSVLDNMEVCSRSVRLKSFLR